MRKKILEKVKQHRKGVHRALDAILVLFLICMLLYNMTLREYSNELYDEYDELYDEYSELYDEYEALKDKEDTLVQEEQNEEEIQEKKEENSDEQEQTESKTYTPYEEGTYKVGTDIPEGEYILLTRNGQGYFSVSSDSTGTIDSIICNDNFSSNTIITVSNNQYFEIVGAIAIPIEQEPAVSFPGEGMYKAGLHFKSGEYKVVADGSGYIEVASDSLHQMDSIISNDNFEGEKYITVSDGQYLTMVNAHIIL